MGQETKYSLTLHPGKLPTPSNLGVGPGNPDITLKIQRSWYTFKQVFPGILLKRGIGPLAGVFGAGGQVLANAPPGQPTCTF